MIIHSDILDQFDKLYSKSTIDHIELDIDTASFGLKPRVYDTYNPTYSSVRRIFSDNVIEEAFELSEVQHDDLFRTLAKICSDIKSTVTLIIKPKLVLMIETPRGEGIRRIELEMGSVTPQDFLEKGVYAFTNSIGPTTHLYYQLINVANTPAVKETAKPKVEKTKKEESTISTIANDTASYIETLKSSDVKIPVLKNPDFISPGMDIAPPPSPSDYINAKLAEQQLKEFKENFMKEEEERLKQEENKLDIDFDESQE